MVWPVRMAVPHFSYFSFFLLFYFIALDFNGCQSISSLPAGLSSNVALFFFLLEFLSGRDQLKQFIVHAHLEIVCSYQYFFLSTGEDGEYSEVPDQPF